MDNHGPQEPYVIDDAGYEKRDVKLPSIVKWMTFLTMFVLISSGVTWFIYTALLPKNRDLDTLAPLTNARRVPPEPRLQANAKMDMRVFREEEDVKVNHYAWADKNAGTVKIPVERAIDLIAERGLPSVSAAEAEAAAKDRPGAKGNPVPDAMQKPPVEEPKPAFQPQTNVSPMGNPAGQPPVNNAPSGNPAPGTPGTMAPAPHSAEAHPAGH